MSNRAEGTEAVSNTDDRHYLRTAVEQMKCPCAAEHLETLDALEAENQRLRETLEQVRKNATSWHGMDPDGIDHAHHGQQKALNVIARWCSTALDAT